MLQRFSLSWDHHNQNVCNGLSSLQEKGELVDMTLAADGHMVKVHQIVMSLISPYLKELILSANCPHPVIFLNKISHTTLTLILEFIYRGEVLVEKETLGDLIQAGKELHIKGLQELDKTKLDTKDVTALKTTFKSGNVEKNVFGTDVNDTVNRNTVYDPLNKMADKNESSDHYEPEQYEEFESEYKNDNTFTNTEAENNDEQNIQIVQKLPIKCKFKPKTKIMPKDALSANIKVAGTDKDYNIDPSMLQYTVSNQGSLQVILNKYIYYLRYTSKTESKHVVWRCVEYVKHRCPAYIVCRGNNVLRRVAMHSHANHERRIKKKMVAGEIFDKVNRAEEYGAAKKQESKTVSE